MKARIYASFAAIILCTIMMINLSVPSKASDLLTVTEVIQISDTQLIIRFSKPIAFNLLGSNRGPYIALRVVDANNILQYSDNSQPLQFQGKICFTDSEHDTILFAYDDGVNNITSLQRFEGDLVNYAGKGYTLKLAIEEVPFDQTNPSRDGLIDNITTVDGTQKLTANLVGGWDGQYSSIAKDFSIKTDKVSYEDVGIPDSFDYGTVLSIKKEPTQSETDSPESSKNDISDTKNSFMPAAILIASVAFSALLIGFVLLGGKKRKRGEKK